MSELKLVQVKDAMNDGFIVCDGLETVADAMSKVQAQRVSTIIIQKRNDNDEYGAVFLSDIAKKVIAKDKSPKRVNLYEIMTKPLLHIVPEMDVRYCARLFEQFNISRAPVIENNEIIGMISYKDIALISGTGE
ncbi:CBS domain-containing protein [Thalassotalea sp. 42_200_T64]|nr:CBS domain-containing protein [Thalassotalea sp. 42_200_T64]